MAGREKKGGDWGWPIIVLLFAFGLWPIALLALFAKLFGSDSEERKPVQAAPPLQEAPAPQTRSQPRQQTKAAQAVRRVTKTPATKRSTARWLKLLGAVMLALGVLAMGDAFSEALVFGWLQDFWWVEDFLSGLALTAAGGGMLGKGLSMDRQLKRFSRYLLVMGDREAVSIEEMARTLGYSERRVEKDLQKMIDKGYFGGRAYLNAELGYLFRSSQADADWKRKQEEAARAAQATQAPKEAEEGYSGILRNIRRANDRIADPVLSAKIDRLEAITAKIFKAVEEDPRKAERIDTFLNYYLPTTQKLLNSYASFESAGVEGENLRQAKQRIETTMDSIVKGFEHQLDELYKADAMDVDTDIRVMEHMLRRDTATTAQDFGLESEE